MDDSTLRSLSIAGRSGVVIDLNPPFARTTKVYEVVVPDDCDAVKVAANPTESDGFAQVQKVAGDGFSAVPEGNSEITIKVEAPDGSSSEVLIKIYRPSSSDANLQAIQASSGVLSPDFHRQVSNYVLNVGAQISTVSVTPVALNPKSSITVTAPTVPAASGPINLFSGDTPITIEVKSPDGKAMIIYSVIIRREKPGFRLQSANDAQLGESLYCSICCNPLFCPRKTAKFPCSHRFCLACLAIHGPSKKSEAGESDNTGQSKCPVCGIKWPENPISDPDTEIEASLMSIPVYCPFKRFGCGTTLTLDNIQHIKTCEHNPVECSQCEAFSDPSAMELGKHKTSCTVSCSACQRKVASSDKDSHERKYCPMKLDIPASSAPPAAAAWEVAMVDRKKYPGDVESCVKQASNFQKEYIRSLYQALEVAASSQGTSKQTPDFVALDKAIRAIATAAVVHTELRNLKGGKIDESLSLQFGMLLEEMETVKSIFPPVTKRSGGKRETNENEEANKSFMSDEVDGLLMSLGVPKTASEATKIKAIEEEYHRLLAAGSYDQAAEVQNLHSWKVKQLKNELNAGQDGSSNGSDAKMSAGLTNAREKFEAAYMVNPSNPDVNCQLGRFYLISSQREKSIFHLKISVGQKPTNQIAKFLLGTAMLAPSPEAITKEDIHEAVRYIEDTLFAFMQKRWYKVFRSNEELSLAQDKLLVENLDILWNPCMAKGFLSLARGRALIGKPEGAIEVLQDLLYLLPDSILNATKRGSAFVQMTAIMAEAKRLMVVLAPYVKSSCSNLASSTLLGHMEATSSMFLSESSNKLPTELIQVKLDTAATIALLRPTDTEALSSIGSAYLYLADLAKLDEATDILDEAIKCFELSIEAEKMGVQDNADFVRRLENRPWYVKLKRESECFKAAVNESKVELAANSNKKPAAAAKKPAAATTAPAKVAAKPTPTGTKKTPAAPSSIKKQPPKPSPASKTAGPPKSGSSSTAGSKSNLNKSKLKTPASKPALPTKTSATTSKTKLNSSNEKLATTSKSTEAPSPSAVSPMAAYLTRLGLARAKAKIFSVLQEKKDPISNKEELVNAIIKSYREALSLSPASHDAYIELGPILERHISMAAVADLYGQFPFQDIDKSKPSQDDLYLHAELTRAFMKEKRFKDETLIRSMIAEGRASGLQSLSKHIETLDAASESKTLMAIYAGVNKKPVDHPDLVEFFKAKLWL